MHKIKAPLAGPFIIIIVIGVITENSCILETQKMYLPKGLQSALRGFQCDHWSPMRLLFLALELKFSCCEFEAHS